MKQIDIIIKSWNAVEYTLLTVKSIKENTDIPHRIVVVDDGSSEETLSKLRKLEGITLIEHKTNKGSAPTAITGFENTSSELFVLMDSDIVVARGWLSGLSEHMKDTKVAIVSPIRYSRLMYPGTDKGSRSIWEEIKTKGLHPEEALQQYLNGKSLEEFGKELAEFNKVKDSLVESPPGFVSTSCVLLRRSTIEKADGIMSPEFKSYGEDVDLCWRVGALGYKIVRSSKVYVHHFEHSSVKANKVDHYKMMDQSNQILYKKWGSQILNLGKKLSKKYNQSEMDSLFPFVKLFNDIKTKGYGTAF